MDPQVLLQHQQQLPLQQGQPLQGQQQQHHEVIPDGDQQSRFQVSPITEERPANLAFDQKGTMSTQLPGELFSRRGNWENKSLHLKLIYIIMFSLKRGLIQVKKSYSFDFVKASDRVMFWRKILLKKFHTVALLSFNRKGFKG